MKYEFSKMYNRRLNSILIINQHVGRPINVYISFVRQFDFMLKCLIDRQTSEINSRNFDRVQEFY